MVSESNINRLPISAWQTEFLRLTAFSVPVSPVGDVDWWETLIGGQPETSVVRPREGERRMEGAFESARLVIQIRPARIDIHMIQSPDRERTDIGFLTIGLFNEVLTPFSQLVNNWLNLESCPEMRRIAFGAVLLYPVENKVIGYRQLAPYLQYVNLDPDNSSDFLYHINRPRQATSGVANLIINRLSKWSVAQIAMAGFVVEPTQIFQEITRGYVACRLELDISTNAERREPLPRFELPQIFTELVNLGREIVVEGDVP